MPLASPATMLRAHCWNVCLRARGILVPRTPGERQRRRRKGEQYVETRRGESEGTCAAGRGLVEESASMERAILGAGDAGIADPGCRHRQSRAARDDRCALER